jgi:hypothetical protein
VEPGGWISRAYYRDADEAIAVARELRKRRIPADVLTLDGRAWLEVKTRFDFTFDKTRYPDPKAALDAIKANDLRVCCWEYPYVSIHNRAVRRALGQGFSPEGAGRRAAGVRLGHQAGHLAFRHGADAACRRAASSISPIPTPTRGGATATKPCSRSRRRDQERFRRAGAGPRPRA